MPVSGLRWVYLARDDIERVVSAHFPQFVRSPELFETLFVAIDSNGDGLVNYRVRTAAAARCRGSPDAACSLQLLHWCCV